MSYLHLNKESLYNYQAELIDLYDLMLHRYLHKTFLSKVMNFDHLHFLFASFIE